VSLPIRIFEDRAEAERTLAREISDLISRRAAAGAGAVIGLATGRTPVGVYAELCRLRAEEGLDFSRVVTFNLDELEGVEPDHPGSFARQMREQLFDRINLEPGHAHVPRGDLDPAMAPEYCELYERRIADAGGIDLQILGIGGNGHIAFNEPGSRRRSRARRVELDPATRAGLRTAFAPDGVPRYALTMGVASILSARRLRLLAFGEAKAAIVKRVVEDPVGPELPVTFVRGHADVELLLDPAAASLLDGVGAKI